MKYADFYLVTADNHNRFYRMRLDGNVITVESGREGATPLKQRYPARIWNTLYGKCIADGYIDRATIGSSIKKREKYAPIGDALVRDFFEHIKQCVKRSLKETYTVEQESVTAQHITAAQEILDDIAAHLDDMEYVNDGLLKLFVVIPRKMKDVGELLADSVDKERERSTFNVVKREQDNLDRLKAVKNADAAKAARVEDDRETELEALGLDIRPCTETEVENIKKHLGEESAKFFCQAFRVRNKMTEKRADAYNKAHRLKKSDIHFYYHGSGNENIYGLMTQGPKINPKNVVYTGSLFGKGCYMAPRAKKSIGYTSLSGSFWKGGRADRAYLMVYKVAYKNALHLTGDPKCGSGSRNFTAQSIKPHDAVYAHKGYLMGAGNPLRNDEAIVYNEAQLDLQYVIVLKAA